jgi:high-affinity iron transporter
VIGAFVIAFREVIEAGLIVSIVLAATRGIAGRGRWIGLGVALGLAGAALLALFARRIAEAYEGSGQELLNAVVLTVAVPMLAWHGAWMARHGREMAGELKAAGESVRTGQRTAAALAIVVGAAILREGAELVLFLYGLIASGTTAPELLAGALTGVAGGIGLSGLSYLGLVALPVRNVFAVTSGLIVLLAAGLAAQAVQFYADAGVITVLDRPVWSTAWLVSEGSLAGKVLHALVGYTERPSGAQVLPTSSWCC